MIRKWLLFCSVLACAWPALAQTPAPELSEADVRSAAQLMAQSLQDRFDKLKKPPAAVQRACMLVKNAVAAVVGTPAGDLDTIRERYRKAMRLFVRASSALSEIEFVRDRTPDELKALAGEALRRFGARAAALRDFAPEQDAAIDQVEMLLATASAAIDSGTPQNAVSSLRSARDALFDIEDAAGL